MFSKLMMCAVLLVGCAGMQAGSDEAAAPNTLTKQEKADGWELLFDGKSMDKWRGYQKDDMPETWAIEDDCIVMNGGAGDIITREKFDDYELKLEWKIQEGGNSGIFYNATEDHDLIYMSAPEMQVLDNSKHNDGKNTLTSAGANYGLIAPVRDVTKPIGEFNQVMIRIVGNHVEHHLNGVKLLEYELGSDEWKELVDNSKFKDWPDYGKASEGHIGLQDHGDKVWYRNIKIRRLNEK